VDGPLGFAHRGASADAPENTLPAFRLALAAGCSGLESDVWLTADGVPALHHGGTLRRGLRRVPIGALPAAALPPQVPRLADLYDACGTAFDLSIDLKDGRAARAVLEVAVAAGHDPARLWLCGRGLVPLAWRALDPHVRLVSDTRRLHLRDGGWVGHLRRLADGGADAVNLRRRGWSRELVEQVHAAGLLAFGWDAQTVARIRVLLDLGCDAVYSDHVDRVVTVLAQHAG
jgi:glycerophosphoryl diester phosphodiesterase